MLASAASHAPVPEAGVDHYRVLGLEYLLGLGQQFAAQRAELWPAVIDRWQAHGAQDAVGHRRWSRNLQKMTTGGVKIEFQHDVASYCCCEAVVAKQHDTKLDNEFKLCF